MAWFVFLFAVVLGLFTEKRLIPFASTPMMKMAIRWNYTNAILMSAAGLHPLLKIVHIAYVFCGAIFAMLFMQKYQQTQAELDKKRELERIAREVERERKRELERIAREAERLARERLIALPMKDFLAEKGCPIGYKCSEMGDDGHGGCENWLTCRKFI